WDPVDQCLFRVVQQQGAHLPSVGQNPRVVARPGAPVAPPRQHQVTFPSDPAVLSGRACGPSSWAATSTGLVEASFSLSGNRPAGTPLPSQLSRLTRPRLVPPESSASEVCRCWSIRKFSTDTGVVAPR